MTDSNRGEPGKASKGGAGGAGGAGGSSESGTGGVGGVGGEGGRGGAFLPPLTKEQLPEPIAEFLEGHPVFVRLYVPFIVTISLIVQLFTTSGRC